MSEESKLIISIAIGFIVGLFIVWVVALVYFHIDNKQQLKRYARSISEQNRMLEKFTCSESAMYQVLK